MNKIRILIADDHAIVRTGLAALLDTEPDIEVVGEAEDGTAAVQKALQLKPDIVIMDLLMPVMDGIEATQGICEKLPSTRVLVLTTSAVSDDLSRALAAGASGVLTKSTANDRLLQAIKDVVSGKRPLSPEIEKLISQDPPAPELTERQTAILHSVTRGLSNPEIARQFGIAEITVKNHLTAIFAKLGASNRSEAVAIALRKQLVKM